jgi:hypothetical protein
MIKEDKMQEGKQDLNAYFKTHHPVLSSIQTRTLQEPDWDILRGRVIPRIYDAYEIIYMINDSNLIDSTIYRETTSVYSNQGLQKRDIASIMEEVISLPNRKITHFKRLNLIKLIQLEEGLEFPFQPEKCYLKSQIPECLRDHPYYGFSPKKKVSEEEITSECDAGLLSKLDNPLLSWNSIDRPNYRILGRKGLFVDIDRGVSFNDMSIKPSKLEGGVYISDVGFQVGIKDRTAEDKEEICRLHNKLPFPEGNYDRDEHYRFWIDNDWGGSDIPQDIKDKVQQAFKIHGKTWRSLAGKNIPDLLDLKTMIELGIDYLSMVGEERFILEPPPIKNENWRKVNNKFFFSNDLFPRILF